MLRLRKPSLNLTLLLIAAAAFIVAGCAPVSASVPSAAAPAAAAPAATVNAPAAALPADISVAEAAAKRDAGAFILDVRQPEEWNAVHIPGATLIPLDQLAARINEVPKDKEVVVVCHSGNRSKQGRDILKNAGFTQVTSMTGGMNQWSAAGLPTATGK
jgi:rhodanese-related sulfurtransferase